VLNDIGKRRGKHIQYLKRIQRQKLAKAARAEVMAVEDTGEARLKAVQEINAPPIMLSNLATEVAQVLHVIPANNPSLSGSAYPPESLTPNDSISDSDLDHWLVHLDGSAPGIPGMVDEGETEDEDVVQNDLHEMRVIQTLTGKARTAQHRISGAVLDQGVDGAGADQGSSKRKRKSATDPGKAKGKGRATSDMLKPPSSHTDDDADDPKSPSEMTFIDYDAGQHIKNLVEEHDVFQLPVHELWKALTKFIIQPVVDE
jgi:hypothetical protein